jgi:hypothetical protein
MGHETDDLTTVRTIEVSLISEIYTRHCLSLAIGECDPAALCILVAKESERATLVRFSGPSGTAPNDCVIRDFLNRVLELSAHAALQDFQT